MSAATLYNGNVVLETRPRSPYLYARMKIGKQWIVCTTKQTDLSQAIVAASQLYEHKKNFPAEAKPAATFKHYCLKYRQLILAREEQKPVYKSYLLVLENTIVPYWGDKSKADPNTLEQFYNWYTNKRGSPPAKTTLVIIHCVLRQIFRLAFEDGYISVLPTLTVKDKGKHGKRRPDFDVKEYNKIIKKLAEFVEKARDRRCWYRREMMRQYVLFILYTGCRPGTEVSEIRWTDIDRYVDIDGKEYIRVWINRGKRGERRIIAANVWLKHLRKLSILSTGWYLFDYRNAHNNPLGLFQEFLKQYDLLYDRHGHKRSLYSLRHTYITLRILYRKLPYHVLAAQCGTSVSMLEKHYAHITAEQNAAELSR